MVKSGKDKSRGKRKQGVKNMKKFLKNQKKVKNDDKEFLYFEEKEKKAKIEGGEKASEAPMKTPKSKGKTLKTDAETPKAEAKTPNAEAKTPNAGPQTPKADPKTPKADPMTPKADDKASKKPDTTPGKTPKKTLKGGVAVEELVQGAGPEARAGSKVGVFYSGKLQASGKQFDACQDGKPFKFKLGAGEVIKGWDVGQGCDMSEMSAMCAADTFRRAPRRGHECPRMGARSPPSPIPEAPLGALGSRERAGGPPSPPSPLAGLRQQCIVLKIKLPFTPRSGHDSFSDN